MSRKRIITLVLSVVIVALFGWYFYENIEDFKVLLEMSPLFLAMVLIGHLVSILTNGFFIRGILSANGISMKFSQSVKASFVSAIGNFFFPIGTGSVAQAKYLKSSFRFNYKKFLSAFSGNYIIVFVINGLLGLISILVLHDRANDFVFYTLLVIFLCMLIPNVYFSVKGVPTGLVKRLSGSRNRHVKRVGGVLREVVEGWNFVTKSRKTMFTLVIVTAVNFLASMLISYAAIASIGVSVGLWALVLYSSLGVVTLILNVTPGSIGVREGVFIFTASLIGLTVSQILVVAIIDRLARFFILLFGLIVFKDDIKRATGKIKS